MNFERIVVREDELKQLRARKRELELRDFSRKQRHGDVANMQPYEVAQMKQRKREKLRKLKGQVAEAEEQAR